MQNQNITVKLHNANKVISTFQATKGPDQPVIIQAKKNVNYEFIDAATQFAPENIKTKRVGNDLHVAFEDDRKHPFETDLIIEDYYNQDGTSTNLLIGLHENGSYYAYVPESGLQEHAVSLLADEIAAGQALGGEPLAAATYTFNPYWLLALIPLAGLAAVASNDSSSKGEKGATGPAGQDGADGKSILDVLIEAGKLPPDATATDLVNYLKGTDGVDGKSALELLIEANELPEGATVTDMIDYLKGADGVNGTNGVDGKSVLELLIEANELPAGSTVTDMINYLKGA
ncbi:hypothetical protein, partial [Acinetobacter indicus]|uniref:hypothetical protein n=1 Tax=Acinetobacter indicus TaxID=756892 RepID=UPI001C0A4CF9